MSIPKLMAFLQAERTQERLEGLFADYPDFEREFHQRVAEVRDLLQAVRKESDECDHGNAKGFCTDCEAQIEALATETVRSIQKRTDLNRRAACSHLEKLTFRRLATDLKPWPHTLALLTHRSDTIGLNARAALVALIDLITSLEESGKP